MYDGCLRDRCPLVEQGLIAHSSMMFVTSHVGRYRLWMRCEIIIPLSSTPRPDCERGSLMAQQTLPALAAKQKRREASSTYDWRRTLKRVMPLVTVFVLVGFWQLVVMTGRYPSFIVPSPADVFERLIETLRDGTLLHHASVTLQEMLLGMFFGVGFAILLGYLIAKTPLLGDLLSPVIVGLQATPTIAYAPLLLIWFGNTITSRVIICAVIVFFPSLMNTVVGIRNVPDELRELMKSLRANPWQTFTRLEIPAALPVLLTGLKTSATLAVIGAVVGEFIGASEGLGFLVISARSRFDTPLVFVSVFAMTALALSFYALISLLEHFWLRWQR